MLNKLFGQFSHDIGIDFGTANTLVYVRGRGIVINEPSVVAINQKTGQIVAIGEEAKRMVGRTPAHIVATRPLVAGVVSDFEVTEEMLKYFIRKVHEKVFSVLARPRVVIGIPSGVTEVEKRAVQDAVGSMIVDIGGGTSDIAVISLGGIVVSKDLKIAGDKLNEDIIRFARDEYKLLLGERTAEDIKIAIGSAHELPDSLESPMRGPELVADIMHRGILLVGGGALLRGLDILIQDETRVPVKVADDPLTAVARGTGIILEDIDALREVLIANVHEAAPI